MREFLGILDTMQLPSDIGRFTLRNLGANSKDGLA